MILFNNTEVIAKYYGGRSISAVYKGVILIWEAVRSCFGSGNWINEKSWINNEAWKNLK